MEYAHWNGNLAVLVESANNLTGLTITNNPWVEITVHYGDKQTNWKTSNKKLTLSPVWNEVFALNLLDVRGKVTVNFRVLDMGWTGENIEGANFADFASPDSVTGKSQTVNLVQGGTFTFTIKYLPFSALKTSAADGGDYDKIYRHLWGDAKYEEKFKTQFPSRDDLKGGIINNIKLDAEIPVVMGVLGWNAKLKHRATHTVGVGASGTIKIVDNLNIPENNFFIPGREFSMRLRHANSSADDDRLARLRSISIKFNNDENESQLDLIMNTGKYGIFWTLNTFLSSTKAVNDPVNSIDQIELLPAQLKGFICGYRRDAVSFTKLHYYAAGVYDFHAKDGKKRYCKFRIVPNDYPTSQEPGLLSPAHQCLVWEAGVTPGDNRAKDYLRQEYKDYLAKHGHVDYRLQIQIRDAHADDTQEVYSLAGEWPEPYQDVAVIHATHILDDHTTERTTFNPSRHTDFLSYPSSSSPDDYYSVMDAREKIYKNLQSVRLHFDNKMN